MTQSEPDPMTLPPNHSNSDPGNPMTLAIDVGGTGLKAARLDTGGHVVGTALRIATPHPSPPAVVVPALAGMANSLGRVDRVSVGFPGAVRRGTTLTAPNLGTPDWRGFDLASALRDLLGVPVRVENDATVQGLGVIAHKGLEVVITLGTGFGFAVYDEGRIGPHFEMSQHVARGRRIYDDYVGDHELQRIGMKRWLRRVKRVLDQMRRVTLFDALYIGGGNARHIDFKLPEDVHIVDNAAGLTGGIHLWNEANSA